MDSTHILRILESRHALIQDSHFVYTSGRHGRVYINKDAIYPDTQAVSALCGEIAVHFASAEPAVVAAPAIGGVILSQWVAYHLSQKSGSTALAVYAEKSSNGEFEFHRGYDKILGGAKVLIVEDILTTGGSVSAVVKAARACGGNIVGVAAICNRGRVTTAQIGDPPELYSLIDLPLESWPPEECPLCTQGVKINATLGKRREFVAQQS